MQGIGFCGRTPTLGILNALHIALSAAMAELHDELAIEIVDALANFFPKGNLVVGIHHGVVWQDTAAAMHGHEGRDDGSYAAAGETCFPIDPGLVSGTVVVIEAPRHVGAYEPVLQGQIAKRKWLENWIRHKIVSLDLEGSEGTDVFDQCALIRIAQILGEGVTPIDDKVGRKIVPQQ